MCVCVCVCVCVCEREIESERRVRDVCCVCAYVCICACVSEFLLSEQAIFTLVILSGAISEELRVPMPISGEGHCYLPTSDCPQEKVSGEPRG